jgi:hypothetical protein
LSFWIVGETVSSARDIFVSSEHTITVSASWGRRLGEARCVLEAGDPVVYAARLIAIAAIS